MSDRSKTSLSAGAAWRVLWPRPFSWVLGTYPWPRNRRLPWTSGWPKQWTRTPGILASKAKVAMAEAELKNARFEVARQVVACWNEIDDQQRAIVLAEEQVKVAAEPGPAGDLNCISPGVR